MSTAYRHPQSWLIAGLALAVACTGSSASKQQTATPGLKGGTGSVTTEQTHATAPEDKVPELVFPDEPFRAQQPEPSEPRPFQLPPVKEFKLKNGVHVYLIEQHRLPTISIDLDFDGGSRLDPKGKDGLAEVCMDMMTEGTEKLDKLAFAEALADIAASVSSYAGQETQGISMRTLSKHLDATFALFADSLLRPGMRQEELERNITRRLEALKQQKATPVQIAGRVTWPVIFGAAHPFGRVKTEQSYKAISAGDCKKFHKRQIKPRGARLFVVGDMSEAQVRERFDGGLKGWSGAVPAMPKLPRPAPLRGKVFFVHVPGAAQSAVTVGHLGPQRKAKEYLSNLLMNAVLGGGFASRINMNLREAKGYSYGARGGVAYTRDYGVFRLSSSVRSDATYQTVIEMMGEMTGLQSGSKAVTAEELMRERNSEVLGLPGNFATARQALFQYRDLVYHGLPLDYYDSYIGSLQAVTPEQVMASARSTLKPEQASILIVGDGDAPMIQHVNGKDEPLTRDGKQLTLREGLEMLVQSGTLGKAELVMLDADGNVVR